MKEEFLQELKTLLEKYQVSIEFSAGPGGEDISELEDPELSIWYGEGYSEKLFSISGFAMTAENLPIREDKLGSL